MNRKIQINRHSRKFLSGIPTALAKQGGDPRLQSSGMTPKGFTLIELLVVVLIIGILAAIALPQYQKAVEKARVAEAITILKEMDKAQQLCTLEHGLDNCQGGGFFENSDYVPPTPLLVEMGEGQCLDTFPCFHTKDWEFLSDDAQRALRIKNGELQDWGLYISSSSPYYPHVVTCDGAYCSSIGM